MSISGKYLLFLFILTSCVVLSKFLKFRGDRKVVDPIIFEKYFPHEKTLCLVLPKSYRDAFWPTFHVPVVVLTQEQVLQECTRKRILEDHDGYVFITTISASLEEQVVSSLKCFNQTTLKLNTKYILVLHLSPNMLIRNDYCSSFFHNLWKQFGIINIAILPVVDPSLDTEPPHIVAYNPFLAGHHSSPRALLKNYFTQDVRDMMIGRFRNLHGHTVNALAYSYVGKSTAVTTAGKNKLEGGYISKLFQQCLAETLNISFFVYMPPDYNFGSGEWPVAVAVREIISGQTEICIDLLCVIPNVNGFKQIQVIPTILTFDIVFVVPMPREVESWQLFQYIFQWQVCVGLGIIMILLSGAAFLFVRVNSELNSPSGTSAIASVWKAALSISVNRLPTTHSQRLLITWSLLLGVIFLTLFSAQMFALIKSKPRLASIKTLRDVHDSNLPIYTTIKQFSKYLSLYENTTLHNLKDNLKSDQIANLLNPKNLNTTKRALVYSQFVLDLIAAKPENSVYSQYFKVVKEPIYHGMMMIYLPIGSVYIDTIKNLNNRLICGGFYLQWQEENKRKLKDYYTVQSTPTRATTPNAPVQSHQTDDDQVPLGYDDLKMAFYLLYVGLAISVLCFLKEVCHF